MKSHSMTDKLTDAIKAEYEKYFDNAGISFRKACAGNNIFFVEFALDQKIFESIQYFSWVHDRFYNCLTVKEIEPGIYEVTTKSLSYRVKTEKKNRCSENVKIPFRKTKGNQEKIVTYMGQKVFKRIADSIRENEYRLFTDFQYNPIEKIR